MGVFDALLEKSVEAVADYLGGQQEPAYFDGQWHPLLSSNVMAFRYDKLTRELDIEFKGGRQYAYSNIDGEMVMGLATTRSPGTWFHANLQGAPAQRL